MFRQIKVRSRVLLVIIVAILVAGGCAMLEKHESPRIMFIPKSQISSFWKITIEGFETAIAEYGARGTICSTKHEEDYEGQAKIVRDAVETGYDAIVISANSYKKLAESVQYAINSGVEVVVVDSDVDVEAVKVRVSTDNYQAGYEMGQTMASLMKYKGNIGMLTFKSYTENLEKRIQGFKDAIEEHEDIKIVAEVETLSSEQDAMRGTRELVESNKEINGIVSFNEIITVAMGKEIEEMQAQNLVAMGFDNNMQVIDYLERGILDGTVVQNQFAMGYLGAQYAFELLNGEKIENEIIDTGVNIVTRENLFDPVIQTILFPFEVEEG